MTIATMLSANAQADCSNASLVGADGAALSPTDLYRHTVTLVRHLRRAGIDRQDRVGIVFPPGVELARALLGVMSGAVAAPLNPAYTQAEFEFNLHDLGVSALLLPQGFASSARAAAATASVPVLDLVSTTQDGGIAGIAPDTLIEVSTLDLTSAQDVVLVLQTSGTTARPKRVPLTNANLCASARNVAASLALTADDTHLGTMPLFHIHGLVCMLASLSAGGRCVFPGAFDAERFASWLSMHRPTWWSGVPTMLQALADCARTKSFGPHTLRLLRSSSASLPPAVMAQLERAFGVPVMEAYGMTEAAHQMACNPLPPGTRVAGSVGVAAGPAIGILRDGEVSLHGDATGEVVILGDNVFTGYESNDEANANAFHSGWFRTGDEGYFSPDGRLFLTGRLKEIINRAGEKIAPREVEEALLAHAAVRQAVVFALPHPTIGEDVAAAVVLHAADVVTEAELRVFLFTHLADFKIPSRILIVDAIPMGATGKIQRIGMAARMSAWLAPAYQSPATPTEQSVAAAMCDVLQLQSVGRHDNFFQLGGDSLRGIRVMARVSRELGLQLPAPLLFRLPTTVLLAARIDELIAAQQVEQLAALLQNLPPDDGETMMRDAGSTE